MALLLLFLISLLNASAATVTFTNAVTISDTDTNYDGQDIIVDGTTVTIDGAHSFNSLLLTNGGVLTHSACTATNTHKLELIVTNAIVVSTNSRIDVSGKGYLAGYTTGNTTNGAVGASSGGSYGGLGGSFSGQANTVYGDYADPDDWGGGGGGGPSYLTSGGGLVRIMAGTLHLDGMLLADGINHANNWGHGGGSGGGIRVAVGQLRGIGSMRTQGGNGAGGYSQGWFHGGGGGGGRIAVYASDHTQFNLTNLGAPGGMHVGDISDGGAGTVYVKDADEPQGLLIVDGSVGGNGWTPLGLPGTNSFTVPADLVLRGSNTRVRPEHDELALHFAGGLRIENGARLYSAGVLSFGSGLALTNGSLLDGTAEITCYGSLLVNGSTLMADRVVGTELLLTNGGVLTHSACTATNTHKLELIVTNAIVVSTNSRIDVSGKGYLAGYTTGNTTNGAVGASSGGSYGGLGGSFSGQANTVYGDYADPDDWGSGAGIDFAGGGVVRLVAGTLVLDGALLANGATSTEWGKGGGSGGGIHVAVNQLRGAGVINASGGNGAGGFGGWWFYGFGGGGGRIAVFAADYSQFNLMNVRAVGGTSVDPSVPPGQADGGAGTVWVIQGRVSTHARYTIPGIIPSFPTNAYSRLINAPFTNGIVIRFNQKIATNSFSPDKLLIQGPLGVITPTGISEIGDRFYHFAFSSQTENGAYRFSLLPTLLDADGFQLDQNANGIPGEPFEDAFSFTLVVDTVAPHITQHSPAGDLAGTVTNVDIWFSEQMDTNTLSVSDVTIFNPTNGAVAAVSIKNVGLNRFRIAFPPQTLTGQYHVLVGTNITDLAGNPLNSTYDASFNLVPVDLELTNVTPSTNQLFAGEIASVAWQGRNNSGAPLFGDWIDAVYLSSDAVWDINDIRLGTVPHTGGLASNQIYSASLNFISPGLVPGNYYLLVRADLGNASRETVETNNIVAYGPIPVMVHTFATNGGSFSGVLTPGMPSAYYAVTVAAGQSLLLNLSANNGVSLYLAAGSIPTALQYDQRATTNGLGSQLALSNTSTNSQTYYLLVSGDQINGTLPFDLSAQTGALFLTGLSPARHGNVSAATVTLTGAGFDDTTAVDFIHTNGTVLPTDSVELVSPLTMRLHLNLTNWPGGLYTLRAAKGTVTNQLPYAFEVVQGGITHLETRLIVPGAVGFAIPIRQTLWVEYHNDGELPMPAPLLVVRGDHGVRITPDAALAIPRGGFGQIPGVSDTAQVMGLGSSSTPWILQPGESGRIPVYYIGLSQPASYPQVAFTLSSVTADDARAIDWAALEAAMRPAGMTDSAWASYFTQIQNYYGATWGKYVGKLNDAVAFRSETENEVPTDVGNIFRTSAYQMALSGVPQPTVTITPPPANPEPTDFSIYPYTDIFHGRINSPYGWRRATYSKHLGIDIPYGQYFPLGAIQGGIGWTALYTTGYQDPTLHMVILEGPAGEHFEYLHVDPTTASLYPDATKTLSNVQWGDVIAFCGNTGKTVPKPGNYHLHLQLGAKGPSPWPKLEYVKIPPTVVDGPLGQGYVYGNSVFMTLQLWTLSMDLQQATIELVQILDQNCQVQTPPFTPITVKVDGSTIQQSLVWEGTRHPYANAWSLNRMISGLPQASQWTFRVTGKSYGGLTRYQEFTYSSPSGSSCQPPGNPGIRVSPTTGVTSESGGAASFSVVLLSQPTDNVSIPLSSDNTGEGTVSTSSLTFTPNNWSAGQSVVVNGVEDSGQVDGDIPYNVILGQASSADARYAAIDPDDVALVNMDNDGTNGQPAIAVSPTSGRTSEGGQAANFSVVLRAAPSADVTVPLSCSDTTEGSHSGSSLTFTPGNWFTAQTVTVTGVDDGDCDGNVSYSVSVGPATSLDPNYSGKSGPSVSLSNEDNEQNNCNCQQQGTCPPPPPPPPPPCVGSCGGNNSTVVGSFDPNEKLGPSGFGASAFVNGRDALPYQIRFENKSDATAPARQVIVTDTLSANLDLNTLELTEIAFANRIIAIPAGHSGYTAQVPMTVTNGVTTNNIVVNVQAALNATNRTLTLTLSALDPSTGWFPEDPLVGLLYPNDDTGRGVGSISYLIKPVAGLPTGTLVQNRAYILFDYNDPIDTPQVANTLDSDLPVSSVALLPANVTNSSFIVSWAGTDVGSGLAGYDVYVSTNGTSWLPWLQDLPANSALFQGQDNRTYYFYSVARDNVGNYETSPLAADAVTTTPTNSSPILDPIADQTVDANSALVVTNRAYDLLLSGQRLNFSLLTAPPGARIENTLSNQARFVWIPACEQGGTTNLITVQVSDNGTPPLTATQSFTVIVSDCVQVKLGHTVVRAGEAVAVPVELLSTVQLSNVLMTGTYAIERFTNLSLLISTQQVATVAFFDLPGADMMVMGLNMQTNHALRTSTGIAQLGMNAFSNQSSAFVWHTLPGVEAYRLDGSMVTNAYGLAGRVVVVGEEPLLEALRAPSNQVALLQYAPTGSTMTIQWSTNALGGNWQPLIQNTQSNLVQETGNIIPNLPQLFFQAVRGTNGP